MNKIKLNTLDWGTNSLRPVTAYCSRPASHKQKKHPYLVDKSGEELSKCETASELIGMIKEMKSKIKNL